VYEVLLGDPRKVRWVSCEGRCKPENLNGTPIPAGHEKHGEVLYIAQAEHEGGLHPGKCGAGIDGALIAWGGTEHEKKVGNLFGLPIAEY